MSEPWADLPRAWLRFARAVGERGDLVPWGGITVACLTERLLGPLLVSAAVAASVQQALVVVVVLSAAFAWRGLVENAHVARTEARLYGRVVDSVLRADVLHASVLPDEEARAALFEGSRSLASLLAQGLPNLCANLVAAFAFAVFVAATRPARVVVVAALAAAAGMAFLVVSRRGIEEIQRAESSAWIRLADGISDAFDGRLDIVASGGAAAFATRFVETTTVWRRAAMRSARAYRLAGRLPLLVLALSVGGAVVVDSVVRGQLPGGTLGQAALFASMAPAFVGVAQGLQQVARSGRRLRRWGNLFAAARASASRSEGQAPRARTDCVELRGVDFVYEREGRRHRALSNVSFAWRRGELLALAGPNGSGKSTVLRAILGLGAPIGGEVLVDGVDLRRIDQDAWRRSLAFLPQRPYLPPRATVRTCLRFLEPEASDSVMSAALERVGLTSVSRREPGSVLDAPVDELSVGQRQRVALARLLCRRSPLVLLDEPDANLDEAGARLVRAIVRDLARDAMVIVAAHSQELLSLADRVLVLESGRTASEIRPAPVGG